MHGVRFGIDGLIAAPRLDGQRLGLVTNDAARTARDVLWRSRVALQEAGFNLVRLFSPEHGLGANASDGAAVANGSDPLTGLPVFSLYGECLRPPRETLADLEAVLCDLPDIGARCYTYIWTLSHVLEACAEADVPLIVLDRPNPLGGELSAAEGPILNVEEFSSFLGRAAIPMRHSLTLGELARLWSAEWQLDVKLSVIPCSGWRRAMHWPETGLAFVPTSPAIPSYESALLYPGLCLFEATNLSVGRGTEMPFQVVGAPWLKAQVVANDLNGRGLGGLTADSIDFSPTQPPFAGIRCHGVRLRIERAQSARPVAAGFHLLASIIREHREAFRWANYPSAAHPAGAGHFERLTGCAGIREILERCPPNPDEHIHNWTTARGWAERTRGHLLYS